MGMGHSFIMMEQVILDHGKMINNTEKELENKKEGRMKSKNGIMDLD